MSHIIFLLLIISISATHYGPPKFHSKYCPQKHQIIKKQILLHHENIELRCHCARLIPEFSLYPKKASINWFFQPAKTNSHELIAAQDPPVDHIHNPPIITKGGGKNIYSGAVCKFPFVANLKEHYACIDTGRSDGRCFCGVPTQNKKPYRPNLDKSDQQENWGFCGCAKPINNQPILTISVKTKHNGVSNKKCHFPFIYKNSKHFSCITDLNEEKFDGRCFCSLVENLDLQPRSFGYCPCAESLLISSWSSWNEWSLLSSSKNIYKRTRKCKAKSKITNQIPHCEGSDEDRKKIRFMESGTQDGQTTQQQNLPILPVYKPEKYKIEDNYYKLTILDHEISSKSAGFYVCSDSPDSIHDQHLLTKYEIEIIDPKDVLILTPEIKSSPSKQLRQFTVIGYLYS